MSGLLASAPAQASHGWVDFTSDGRWRASRPQSAPTAGSERRFEVADLNGDGKLDFATNILGGVESALGNGDGTFQDLRYFGDGVSPKGSFALGDLNRDGILDAVTADVNTGENTVSVFLGDGSGGFGPATAYATGPGRRWLALGDVNRDGKLDLAFVSSPSGGPYSVGVALGNGTGGFGAPTTYSETAPPSEVSLADLNNDGKLDLLWIQSFPNQVSYRFGNGNGTFGTATRLATGASILDLQISDLNRDGRLDLVWVRDGAVKDTANIALALPAGGFGAPSLIALGGDSEVLAVADFTEDGTPDLVSLLKDGRAIYNGRGDGTFEMGFRRPGLPINFNLTNVVIADMNQDGHDDIVYGLPAVEFGIGNGTFGDAQSMLTAAGPSAAVFANVDADALPDLVVACRGAAVVSLLMNTGGNAFLEKQDFPIGTGATAILAADFDGNGRPDIVTANQTANTVSLLRNTGLVGFFPKVDFAVGSSPVALRSGDLNADGKMDLLVLNNASPSVSVMLGNGAGSFAPKNDFFVSNTNPTDLVVADFNNDGKLDYAVAGNSSGAGGILVRLGNGNGTFGTETSFEANKAKRSLAAGDFNKDGKVDLAASDVSFQVTIFNGNGNGTFSPGAVYYTTANAFTLEAADVDNDSNLDLLLGHSFGFVWVMKGTSSGVFEDDNYGFAGCGATAGLFTSHQIMAVGDWVMNGRRGIALVGETSNTVTLLRNRGPAIDLGPQGGWLTAQGYPTQADPRGIAIADFNRDGRRDAAAASAGSNEIAVHLGESNGTLSAGTGFAACPSVRSLDTGDLNRDGMADAITVGEGGMMSVLIGNGIGGFAAKTDVTSGGPSHDVALADFDQNGTLDAVVDDTGVVRAFPGVGNGTFGAGMLSNLPSGSGCTATDLDVADINGDGKPDVVAAAPGCGHVDLLLGNGALSFTGTALTMGSQPGHVVVADFNRDGKLDIAAADQSSDAIVVRLQNPTTPGAFLAPFSLTGIASAGDLATADVDHDGDLDLLVGSNTLSSFAVLKNGGTGTFGSRAVYAMTDPVVSIKVEDLNRDGLLDVMTTGSNGSGNTISVRLGTRTTVTGVAVPPVSAAYTLGQNRPNPFNPVTKIRFAIGRAEPVRLRVFDARGRLVATLLDKPMAAGMHEVSWMGKNDAGSPAASGVYFYKLEAGEFTQSKRMVLLK